MSIFVIRKICFALPLEESLSKAVSRTINSYYIVTGKRPIELIRNEKERYIFVDGRPKDLRKGISNSLMPLISQNYHRVIKRCRKILNEKNIKSLNDLTMQAQKEGKMVRLWKSPEKSAIWQILLDNGISLINTDYLNKLSSFLIGVKRTK